MQNISELERILERFGIKGVLKDCRANGNGHINSTYLAEFDEGGVIRKYTLQKINTDVFKNPDELMKNIVGVTEFIKSDGSMKTLDFLPCDDGKYYCFSSGGDCWRCYRYIDDVFVLEICDSSESLRKTGEAFGRFQNILADYPIGSLYDTIPDFHNTPKRFEAFLKAVNGDAVGRAASVEREISFVKQREPEMSELTSLIKSGELPLRVTHNDTKLNNVLFDKMTGEGVCIIDLDTIMPGLSLYDFGDAIRYGANTAAEDEKDLEKVHFSLDYYRAYCEGYLSQAGKSLNEKEIELLPFSARLMTLECGMRFLTDYLNGDVYFHTAYGEHNLVRARVHFRLIEEMEESFDEMKKITASAVK